MKKHVAFAVLDRAALHCEKCGWPASVLVLHHRRKRSQGGRDTDFDFDEDVVANLMAVHPHCHDLIHSYADWSIHHGWLVRRSHDPARIPVFVNAAEKPPKGWKPHVPELLG